MSSAYADETNPAEQLREIFPNRGNLDVYLSIVSQLIANNLNAHWEESRLDAAQQEMFEPLVRATAWKETCWLASYHYRHQRRGRPGAPSAQPLLVRHRHR